MNTNIKWWGAGVVVLVIAAFGAYSYGLSKKEAETAGGAPQQVTLSGTYECLPYRDTSDAHDDVCAFGIRTDSGEHYAVNFGQSAEAMQQFQHRAHIRAEGFIMPIEAVSAYQWEAYDIRGIFTVTRMLEGGEQAAPSAKINIDAVCEGALAYMTFPDGASADAFVAECKEGAHPEVIEQYKAQLNLDGAAI